MQELQEKIRENIKVSPDTSCWLWQRSCGSEGYGQVWYEAKLHNAHRAAYIAFNGEIPKGLIVRHTCDVRACCNPNHLEVGTYQDNTNDMLLRGREAAGEKHSSAKLTWKIVREIRATYEPRRVTLRHLAEMYGVSTGLIGHIIKNRTWKEEHYDNQK